MLEILTFNLGGIPIVFWATMTSLLLAMHFIVYANIIKTTQHDEEKISTPAATE